ncbi:hypothetical protein G5I_04693 [Acromyrmex echinatior]|uniref:Uncharacterized protein n=1 Tax=Acromyrmex echinatior TaxID=103372 RepID=F4WGB9_ACREC|nr:hypothetical protein G5I_04693 [Acromyrmex echinatior]
MTGDYSVRVCAIAVGGAASRSLHLCKRASGAMEQRTRTRRPRKRGSRLIDRSSFLRARFFVLIGNDNREIQGVLGGTPGPRTGAENPLVDPARASGNAGAVETQKHGRRSFDGLMGYRRRGSPTVIHTAVLLRPPGGAVVSGGPLGHVDTTHFYAMSSSRWAAAVVPREDPLFMLLYAGAGRTTARWAE